MYYLIIPLFLIITGITALFFIKTFLGAVILGIIDIVAGFFVMGIPAGTFPHAFFLYLGAVLIAKGVYSLVSGIR